MRRACAPTSRHVTRRLYKLEDVGHSPRFTFWLALAAQNQILCRKTEPPPAPHRSLPNGTPPPTHRGGSRVNVFTECRHGARRPAELFAQAHGRGPSNIKLRLLHGKTTSDWTKGVRGPPLRERNQLRSRRMSRWAQVGRVDTRTATNYLFKNQTICAIN